ncbi:MAG: rhomboid family intramembrane serine protease [Chloroflexota bacterium]
MIPLRDANPTRRTPVVTLALIVACFVAFAWELGVLASGGEAGLDRFVTEHGVVPADVTGALHTGNIASAAMLGIVTSMFLHAGWIHLLGNMLYLWIFGNNVEDRLGRPLFLLFYLLGGVAAVAAQVAISPGSTLPLIGASGAIAATLGAYLVIYPRARILSLVFLGFFYQLIEVPALLVLGFWFVLQLIDGAASLGASSAQGGVAFFAHIGGFAAGALAGLIVRGRGPRPLSPATVG